MRSNTQYIKEPVHRHERARSNSEMALGDLQPRLREATSDLTGPFVPAQATRHHVLLQEYENQINKLKT